MIKLLGMSSLLVFTTMIAFAKSDDTKNAVEVGNVNWGRNYEEALTKVQKEKKPMLLFFQEVPG